MSIRRLTAAATLIAFAGASHALETHWNAASGQLPDVVDPAWTLVDEGGGSPSFANGVLTFQTSGGHGARQFYAMQGAELDFSSGAPFWIEAEMQYGSGSQTSGWWRAPAHIGIRLSNGYQASLGIRRDSIFILQGDNAAGDTAVVDTDGAFHTYRMEVWGTQNRARVDVYQDGVLVLSDDALYTLGVSGSSVSWGEASQLATGTTHWKGVRHNMAAVAVSPVPEPATWGPLAAGLLAVGAAARRQRAAA
jgi:hypothetical protein